MACRTTNREELEEQRCLIERQQVEILRHKHHIEMQRRWIGHLEAELNAINVTSQRAAPTIPSTPAPVSASAPTVPRTGTDKEAIRKPAGTVIPVRCACVRRIGIVAIRANWRTILWSDPNSNLHLRMRCWCRYR